MAHIPVEPRASMLRRFSRLGRTCPAVSCRALEEQVTLSQQADRGRDWVTDTTATLAFGFNGNRRQGWPLSGGWCDDFPG